MPDELAFELGEHYVVTVELRNDLGSPMLGEGLKLFLEIDGWHDALAQCVAVVFIRIERHSGVHDGTLIE